MSKKVCIVGASGKLGRYMIQHALAKGYQVNAVWRGDVGDDVLASNITRRIDFALFVVEVIENDSLVQVAPAIVSCVSASAQLATQVVES